MKVIKSIPALKSAVRRWKSKNRTIGFAPTMGYLHEGHLSLVRASKKKADVTVVSIFVNPTQFGPKEDFRTYPRDFEGDAGLLEKEGVDVLFYPDAEEMYPGGYKTYVEVHDLQDKLCGRSRPGHFRGVSTVVLKLFNIVRPDYAFFGQKDAQQATILRRMARDLDLDVRVEVMPIVREADGLAMSSRNTYLGPDERKAGLSLSRSLCQAKMRIDAGERKPAVILSAMKEMIAAEPLARIDYIEAVDMNTLEPVKEISEGTLIALAVFIGKTRLIDNMIV
jgi:pantoate--beta-alanine ligase